MNASDLITAEAVLFDFGGTLDADGETWWQRFEPIYRDEGLDHPEDELRQAFYDADDHLPERFPLAALGLEETVRLQVGCVVGRLAPGREDLAERVTQRFVADARAQIARNRPLLEDLRGRFRLGVVSNFYGNLEAVLASVGLAELFDAVADSAVVGVTKPEPGIFAAAAAQLGFEPPQAVMVGDSIGRDMRGAEALGMPHAWLAGRRDDSSRCCPAAPVLHHLEDLIPLLAEATR